MAWQEGWRTVLTNRCFDILYVGYLIYCDIAILRYCVKICDFIIAGLSPDCWVSQFIKGTFQISKHQGDKAYILVVRKNIVFLVIFNAKNPYECVKAIRPHIVV